MNFGTTEMLVILAIVVLLFGAKRIPDLMRGFGEGIKSFKEGMREGPGSAQSSASAPPVETAPPAEKKS
jgi:sec-independent protein translocase protein TatA